MNDPLMLYAIYLVVRDGLLSGRQARKPRKPHDEDMPGRVTLLSRLQALYARLLVWLRQLFHRLTLR
jgi:hypothetical protein